MKQPTIQPMRIQAIRMPDKLWRRAKQAAAAQGEQSGRRVSVGEYVRTAIERQLDRDRR